MINNYSNLNVIILGGAGFIGYNLAKRLISLDANVTLVDNLYENGGGNAFHIQQLTDKCEIIINSIEDKETLACAIEGKDVVFNLAGQTSHALSMTAPGFDFNINANTQIAIAEAMLHNPAIIHIYTSTRQVYGDAIYMPVDELHPICAPDINAVSKLAAESIYEFYSRIYGLNTKILRLTNIYGPGMRIRDAKQMFLGEWLRRSILAEPLMVFGDGSLKRDLLFIEDLINLMSSPALVQNNEFQIFNVGDPSPLCLSDIAKTFKNIFPDIKIEHTEVPSLIKIISPSDFATDNKKISRLTGWFPDTSFDVGLAKTISYYVQNMDTYS
jgi:UDP-glucose 4-epimerase